MTKPIIEALTDKLQSYYPSYPHGYSEVRAKRILSWLASEINQDALTIAADQLFGPETSAKEDASNVIKAYLTSLAGE